MSASLSTVAYLGATILFILCLGGLSNQETSRRGNLYGMIGMTIAVLATIFGVQVTAAGLPYIIGAMVVGAGIGLYAARTVQMTQMPELVALMHSLVGLAACLVGFASYVDTSTVFATPAEKAILGKLSPSAMTATTLAGDPIIARLTRAPGNNEPIGGLKVVTDNGWFAARPSGTEDVYKIYAESFKGEGHLKQLQQEAQAIVADAFRVAGL